MGVAWVDVFADVPEADVDAALRFWSDVVAGRAGTPTGDHGEFLPVVTDDADRWVWVQRVHRPPGRAGWHLDLETDAVDPLVERAVTLGARVVDVGVATVMASPAGLPFCIVRHEGASRAPAPRSWPGGDRSLPDQLCLDLPPDTYDRETSFWADLTGWPVRAGDLAEFRRLTRPPGAPVQFLLQRLRDDDRAGPRCHVDLAASDRAAEVRRHADLGATVERVAEHWTVMRDPAGLTYCVTDRTP